MELTNHELIVLLCVVVTVAFLLLVTETVDKGNRNSR